MGRFNRKKISVFLTAFVVSFVVFSSASNASEYVEVSGVTNKKEVEKECDAIIKRLEKRYGKPNGWKKIPVVFGYTSPGIAGYCSSSYGRVLEVRIGQSFEVAKGGSLDHELTHAFVTYSINGSTNLFFNEGTAQNSEYKNRKYYRKIVCELSDGRGFVSLRSLVDRNGYDSGMLLYRQSFSVVDFLIAQGGSVWFLDFFKEAESSDFDRALRRYYGYENLEELEKDWLKYVKNGQNRKDVLTIYERLVQ